MMPYKGYTLLVYEYANSICVLHTFHRLVDLQKVNIFDEITDLNSTMTLGANCKQTFMTYWHSTKSFVKSPSLLINP